MGDNSKEPQKKCYTDCKEQNYKKKITLEREKQQRLNFQICKNLVHKLKYYLGYVTAVVGALKFDSRPLIHEKSLKY